MKETGIIMSGDHPAKILDGTKTMTRRTAGLNAINTEPDAWVEVYHVRDNLWRFISRGGLVADIRCPYGQVGDRLLIKETWATEKRFDHLKPSDIPRTAHIWYLADGNYSQRVLDIMGKVRSAMFMCYWMSRARPEITELRAERLQEIPLTDVKKEGIHDINWYHFDNAVGAFAELWDSLNAKRGYGWDTNPWLWVIGFKLRQETP